MVRSVDSLLEHAVARRQIHAGVLLAAAHGQIRIHRAYGRARLDSVFDLASLTKPLATTAVAMKLHADGRLPLSAPLSELVPHLRDRPLGSVRPWHLLSHSSGLPAWRPFYEEHSGRSAAATRAAVRRAIAREPLDARPGSRSVYSDLGFILLDQLLQRIGRARLDRLAARWIYRPLGLSRTRFFPLGSTPDSRRAKAARFSADEADRADARGWPLVPTERCPRRGRLRGEVHDDNCHAMGGVCGHAGLFSTAHDVHLLARELVAAYRGHRSLFAPATVRRFWRRAGVPGSSWALGWDTGGGATGSGGRYLGQRAVGHLGFTGTSLWIDPERALWVILLTNRVYYGREPNPMKRLRPRLHDAVLRALGGPD